jgi:hypothetical protein
MASYYIDTKTKEVMADNEERKAAIVIVNGAMVVLGMFWGLLLGWFIWAK